MLSKSRDSMLAKARISSGFASLALYPLSADRESISECCRLKEQA